MLNSVIILGFSTATQGLKFSFSGSALKHVLQRQLHNTPVVGRGKDFAELLGSNIAARIRKLGMVESIEALETKLYDLCVVV